MLLRNLFEARMPSADAAFAFGRFNPAHQGHIEVYKAVQAAGDKWFVGTNPSTQGPNDPLTFEQKAAWMNAIYPPIKGHILAEQSVVTLASKLYEIIGDDKTIAYVTDSNDWAWAGKLLNDYNGKEGPHGYYKFKAIKHVESPRVSSATALRVAARASDEAAFYAASGTDPKLTVNGQTYYDTVVAAVGANPEKVKRIVKKKEPAVAEVTGDKSFDSMMRTIKKGTAKQKTADRRAEKADSQQRARDAFGNMFGGNPADKLGVRKQGVAEGFSKDMSTEDMIAYLRQHHDKNLHQDYLNHITSTNSKFVLKNIPLTSIRTELSGLDQSKVEQYKQMDFSKAPPIVIGSDGNILDGYHRATVAKALGIPTIKAYVGVKGQQGVAEGKKKKSRTKARGVNYFFPGYGYYGGGYGGYGNDSGGDGGGGESAAMANTAKRLTDPKDGAVAKLRAAGDKRREDDLKSRNIAKKNETVDLKTSLQELSNDMLGKYKKAAGADAKKADAAGDFKRGDKRFSGIVKATNKQFDNDAKKTK